MTHRYIGADGVQVSDRQMQPDQPTFDESIPFDETDDRTMHDVMGNDRLAKPAQALLLTLRDINAIKGSFGSACVDKAKFYDAILPSLEKLRDACEAEWQDRP